MRSSLRAWVIGLLAVTMLPTAEGWAKTETAFAATAKKAIETVIVPAHAAFAEVAAAQAATMERLCGAPAEPTLSDARTAFSKLVPAFSRIEPYRFGPAREDNRFERLFFWPDRRSRGLRQVQQLTASGDEAALAAEALRAKSVAVQGLLALEYVLFGADSATLAGPEAGYRCRYGQAVALAIRDNADALLRGWTAADGHGALMQQAGPDNPVYRTHGDAAQVLFQAAREQLQVVRDLKLRPALGKSADAPRPIRAPFWRSDLALVAMVANIDAVRDLLDTGGLKALAAGAGKELEFELRQARRAIENQAQRGQPIAAILADAEGYDQIAYAIIPLDGAISILAERIPQYLGLVAGFNSLDGD